MRGAVRAYLVPRFGNFLDEILVFLRPEFDHEPGGANVGNLQRL